MSDGTALGDFLDKKQQDQAQNPASPAGAQQLASAAPGTKLGAWLADEGTPGAPGGYVGSSQGWLTGANTQGTNNGWDNQFVDDFMSGWGQALKNGTARTYFENGGTGVVTWDHASSDGTKLYQFGDVYENGHKTGNLYDMYSKDEANLMIAPFLLDAKTQAETYSASDRVDRLDREITSTREDRNANFENSLKALEFEGDVQKREEAFKSGFGDEGVVAASAVGTAGLGAGLGSFFGPAGTVIGGAGGFVVGGVAGYLNKDSLTEQAARAYEITSMSKDQFGLGAGIATGINQWAGFGMRSISPISNLSQGIYDAAEGDVGDGTSEFYRTDKAGQNKAPLWMRGIDVAATVGDSLLQFSNPIGIALYTGTMGSTIAGEVSELALTKGSTFDPRRGGFDNIFTDENGDFDASAAAAGIGKIGIDAVQMGMVRGLAGRTNALRAAAGEKPLFAKITDPVKERLPLWAGGSRGLAEGEERVVHAGFSMTKGADGKIVDGSMRPTLGILAPSEQLQSLSARVIGMRQAALRGGAYSADDFYHAAHALAAGERKIQTVLVNAIGEGYEEAAQAVLEPHSHGGPIDGGDVVQSAIYGAAAGVGMGAGMGARTPSAADQQFAMASLAHYMAYGEELDRKVYNGWTDLEKRAAAGMSEAAQVITKGAFTQLEREQARSNIESVAGYARVADALETSKAADLARASSSTDHAFVIAQQESAPRLDADGNPEYGEIPVEGIAGSARQIMQLLEQHTRGMEIALQHARDQLTATDPADQPRLDELNARIVRAELTLQWAERLAAAVQPIVGRIENAPNVPILEAETADLNETLRRAFHRELDVYEGQPLTQEDKDSLARATSLVFVRDPQDQAGSYQVLMPQVSARLTANLSHNVLELNHAVLTPISGDYDGDKIRQQAQLVFDDNEFARARGGGHYIGAGGTVNIPTPKHEVYLVDKMAESFSARSTETLRMFAQETLNDIAMSIRKRYDRVIDPAVLDEVLLDFFVHVRANDKDSRAVLMDGLAKAAGGEITEFGQRNLTNEWLWIDQLIVSTMQRFQEAYATHRPDRGPDINSSMVTPLRQSRERRERRALKRATLGQTLAAFAPGDSLFRKFQKLHYSSPGAAVQSSEHSETSTLSELADIYRELGQAVTRTDLEQIQSRNDITGRVFTQLNALAKSFRDNQPDAAEYSQAEAMLVIANTAVADLNLELDGTMTETGKVISLTQMLLKLSVMQDRREKSRIYDSSAELQAQHAKLLNMTRPDAAHGPEEAFVEVFGAQQMYALLGDQANIFGPHLTLEQFVREFASGSPAERRDTRLKLMTDSAYLGRKQSKDMPYRLSEHGEISAYRSVVDAIVKVGAARITIDEKTGKLTGELAKRSNAVSSTIRGIHADVQQALRQFLNLPGNGKLDTETMQQAVARMLETRPEVNTALMNLIPKNVVPGAFTRSGDGKITPAAWLYEFLTAADADRAEMILWRNLLFSSWKAKGVTATVESEDDGEHARTYGKLTRRMHRVMYSLAQRRDGGLLYTEFVQRMYNSTNLEEFMRWVNTHPGVHTEGAPLVSWIDDVAEFDKDKAAGGWTTILEGAELREAITTMRQRTKGLVDQLAEEQTAMNNDVRTISAIRRVLRKDAGENVALEAGDRELHDRMVEALKVAESWQVALGPQAMINMTVGAIRGLYGQAHNKGVNPEHVDPQGALDAQVDGLDFLTGYERVMHSLTAVNLDAVGNNFSHAVKDAGRTMDDEGRQITWSKPTVEQMLNYFDNVDTRAAARAMLFPQVMEVDVNNQIRPHLLFGKSLTDLLNGVSLSEMFATEDGYLSESAALKYSTMLDGMARKFGGHQAVGRAANDLVIARTSAADHVLTEAEEHRLVVEAYRDNAEVLQAVGVVAKTNPAMLAETLDALKKSLRLNRVAQRFGLQTQEEIDLVVEEFRQQKAEEQGRLIDELALARTNDPANADRYNAEIEAVEREGDAFEAQFEMLLSSSMVSDVVAMFTGAATNVRSREATLDFIRTHPEMIGRVPTVRLSLNKLTQQLSDPNLNGQVYLTDKEWDELSNAAIGVYLDEVLHGNRGGGTISPWPDGDAVQNQKYYDTTFAYLAEELLNIDSPLVKAATEIAGAHYTEPMTQSQLIELLDRTVLSTKKLGPWTSDIIDASLEAHARLNAAATPAAIAMYGNAPKRQSVIDAATTRTTLKPGEELLSTVRLTTAWLDRDPWDEINFTSPAGERTMPLAQVSNRFAKSVTMEYTDENGQPAVADLMSMVGNPWMRDTEVRESGYQIIHIDRIKRAVDRMAGKLNVSPAEVVVNVEFFHPDSQPAESGWYNNVYFEGTSFELDADGYPSLAASLWFSPNGISQLGQRKALDASKTGKPALEFAEGATADEREALETIWLNDMAAMLRAKTEFILRKDALGLDHSDFYNAIYKDQKLRHFVRVPGQDGGPDTLLTAEEVIARQAAGEQITGELYIPSDDALRTMLGEQGTQGVVRPSDDTFEFDQSRVPSYQGVTSTMNMMGLVNNDGPRDLLDTRLRNRGRQSQLRVDIRLSPEQQSRFDAKMQFFNDERMGIHDARAHVYNNDPISGFNAARNLQRTVEAAGDLIRAEDLSLLWGQLGLPFGPRSMSETKVSEELLKSQHSAMKNDGTTGVTGWIYREGSKGLPLQGILNERALTHPSQAAYRVAPGDLVLLELETFGGDLETLKKRLDYFVERGANVVLASGDARGDMRAEAASYLMESGYDRIMGSKHAYQPIELGSRYQNTRARLSDLTATRTISRRNRVAVFSVQGLPIMEGGAMVNPNNERLGSIGVQANLVPTEAFAGFNVPATPAQIEAVRAKLFGLNNDEGRALLAKLADGKGKSDERELRQALDRFFDRLLSNDGSVLPQPGQEFRIGDIVPLVDNNGRILLYRHGMKAPMRSDLDWMADQPFEGELEPAKIAIYPSRTEDAATTHSGVVREFRPRPGYGLEVILDVALDALGNKIQLEWNGLKYVTTPWPGGMVMPNHGFFTNMGVDILSDLPSLLSKESTTDMVDNHANAFAFFGIDFLPDVTEFFYPGHGTEVEYQEKAREALDFIARRGDRIPVRTADEIMNLIHPSRRTIESLIGSFSYNLGVDADQLVERMTNKSSNEAKIATAMITYLLTPGAKVSDVLRSGGMNNEDSDNPENRSRIMPRLFTQVFDNAEIDSDLRVEINRRLNDQLYNPNASSGYVLHQDFTFETRPGEAGKNLRGFLSFAEAHSSGDNPVKNGMTFDPTSRQGVSVHSAAIAHGALGVETAYTSGLEKTNVAAKLNDAQKDMADGGAWRTLRDVPAAEKDHTFKYWHAPTPAEAARRSLAREAMVTFRQPIVKDSEHGWTEEEIREYNDLSVQIVQTMKLSADQAPLVDFWVRQMLGDGAGRDSKGVEQGRIFGSSAIAEAKEILWAVQNRYLPVVAAEIPLIHLHDLQAIYRANRGREDGWAPRDSVDRKAQAVTTWNGWTEVALGSALTSDNRFDPFFLLSLDGFMHTYQAATRSLMELPVSLDALKSQQLMDPDFNHMLVSVNAQTNQLASNPMVLDAHLATINEVLGGKRIQGRLHTEVAPASEIAKRRKHLRKWRKTNGVPIPADISMKNFRKNGAEFIDEATTTNALIRGLIQLRLGTALINPALYVSMGPEQWIRGALDRAANLITAQSTVGAGAMTMAKHGWSRYTSEDLIALRQTYQVLGQRNDFKGMLYADLGFKAPHGPGGRVMRALEAYGRFGTSMQDPTYGMRANTLARRYLEGALQDILATPTMQVLSVRDLAAQMQTNPRWLEENMPTAHRAGLNAVAQIRSLKQTTLNHAIRGIIDPMAESKNPGINTMSNLLLKIPLFFSTYATNVATSILGLQGVDQMTAAFLQGRNKGLIGRIQSALRGDELPDNADATFDFGDVMEGVDLSRAFIRGALTHTGLFAFGMWAAGLGLGGEDDEMRRRRLLARAQGVGNIYDPRRIENDFRNADALYLDALPFGLGNLFGADPETGRAMYQMHWVMRQFISPVIGMEKFFETGDFRHVTWGFEDAMGSFPLINTMMFDDVVHTAGMLTADADKLAQGDERDQVESMGMLTRAVGTYERMLFENSFVNQLYIGMDRYDRDPYIIPLTDSDGTLQRDIEGNTRPQNLALDTFYDPETHELRRGYLNRDQASIDKHVLSENRATFAFVSSLFTGGMGQSDYWRYNMPVKTREFEKAPVSLDEVKSIVGPSTGGPVNQQRAVTVEEVLPEVRNHLYEIGKKQDHFYTDKEIWSAARSAAAAINAQHGAATALSDIDANGNESPTIAGAKALMLGLYHGTIKIGDAAMRGFYVTEEQRDQIAADWTKELVQEGIELGLDKTRAVSRMKRIMYGPTDNPSVPGLREIIYAPEEQISWSKTQTYAQLNTTYVVGPDGRPWATGFERDKLMAALGLKWGERQVRPENGATMLDSRMNVADMAAGLNTGLRALEPLDKSRNVPTDVELEKKLERAIAEAAKADYQPFDGNNGSSNGGYAGYGKRGSGGGGAYFSKMYALPNNIAPYGNSVPFINTSNPIIRRADVRRERVWSERGRLNQWQ